MQNYSLAVDSPKPVIDIYEIMKVTYKLENVNQLCKNSLFLLFELLSLPLCSEECNRS